MVVSENTKKTLISIVILILAGAAVWYFVFRETLTVEEAGPEKTEAAVTAAFEGYRLTALNKDGVTATTHVTQNTIDYYDEILDLIKYGTKEEVKNRRLIDRMTILIIRHEHAEQTRNLKDGKELLEYSIGEGLVGSEIANFSIASVEFVGDEAYIKIQTPDGVAPQKMRFNAEGGRWKMDIVSIIPLTNTLLADYLKQNEVSEDEFLLLMLESNSGIKPTEKIWEPLVQ